MKSRIKTTWLFLLLCSALVKGCQLPILCVFFTPSHEHLYENWLKPSLQDEFDIVIGTAEQDCARGSYYAEGWTTTTKKKVEHIVKTVQSNMDRLFIFADVDIQFFTPIVDDIKALLKGYEFVVQRDSPQGHVCSGFFAFECTTRTLLLWKTVLAYINKHPDICDQWALFHILVTKQFPIKWKLLPDRYFGGGSLTGTHWQPGKTLPVPDDIVMHHANWCTGIDEKMKQLEYVRSIVKKR
jgi:hypothetical protein